MIACNYFIFEFYGTGELWGGDLTLKNKRCLLHKKITFRILKACRRYGRLIDMLVKTDEQFRLQNINFTVIL